MMLTDLLLEGSSPVARRFFNALAEEPETVAAALVPQIKAMQVLLSCLSSGLQSESSEQCLLINPCFSILCIPQGVCCFAADHVCCAHCSNPMKPNQWSEFSRSDKMSLL